MRLTDGGEPWSWPSRPLEPGDVQPSAEGVVRVLQRAWQLIPSLRSMRVARVWAGLLDVTPDEIPVIERTEVEGFIVAAGFSGHGFCLGPSTGRIHPPSLLCAAARVPGTNVVQAHTAATAATIARGERTSRRCRSIGNPAVGRRHDCGEAKGKCREYSEHASVRQEAHTNLARALARQPVSQ